MPPRAAVAHDETAPDQLARAARRRVVIEHVQPEIDGGRFPIKRTPGEAVVVTADVFADGHDRLAGVVKFRDVPSAGPDKARPTEPAWTEIPLTPLTNDSWTATFVPDQVGRYE